MIREDYVVAVINAVGELAGEDFGRLLDEATGEEIAEATRRLRNAALVGARPIPDVLSFDLWTLATLAAQGRCLEWVGEQLRPLWRSWPARTLADVLKIESPERCAMIRDALRRCGLHTDQGATGEADDDGLSVEP